MKSKKSPPTKSKTQTKISLPSTTPNPTPKKTSPKTNSKGANSPLARAAGVPATSRLETIPASGRKPRSRPAATARIAVSAQAAKRASTAKRCGIYPSRGRMTPAATRFRRWLRSGRFCTGTANGTYSSTCSSPPSSCASASGQPPSPSSHAPLPASSDPNVWATPTK